ncbi:MAG: signal protein [Verrucomicrobiota bacterium]|nr:signal protein [Verrucomicrobiota bacterium]
MTSSPAPSVSGTSRAQGSAPATSAASPAASPTSGLGNFFKRKSSSPAPAAAATATPANNTASSRKPVSTSLATPAPGGGNGLVWVNTETHVYHKDGSRFYGRTKAGKYMTEAEAVKEGNRDAKRAKE